MISSNTMVHTDIVSRDIGTLSVHADRRLQPCTSCATWAPLDRRSAGQGTSPCMSAPLLRLLDYRGVVGGEAAAGHALHHHLPPVRRQQPRHQPQRRAFPRPRAACATGNMLLSTCCQRCSAPEPVPPTLPMANQSPQPLMSAANAGCAQRVAQPQICSEYEDAHR